MKAKVKPRALPEGIEPGRLVWRGNGRVWILVDRQRIAGIHRNGRPFLFQTRKVIRFEFSSGKVQWRVWAYVVRDLRWFPTGALQDSREAAQAFAVVDYIDSLRESVVDTLAASQPTP